MNRTRISLLLATGALCLGGAAAALAAPDQQGAVSAAAPTYTWDGAVATGAAPLFTRNACTSASPIGRYCEQILVEFKDAGKATFEINDWNADSDLDMFVYESDASGSSGGEEVGQGIETGPGPEKVAITAKVGFYLVYVNYYQAVNSGYKGTVTLQAAGAPAPAPAPAPGGPPPPPPSSGGGPTPVQPSGNLSAQVRLEKAKLKAILKSGVPVRIGCTVSCKATLTLSAKLGKKTASIGKATVTVTSKEQLVKVKLSRKAKKALKKAKKVKVSLKASVTDTNGGQAKNLSASATYKK